MSSRTPTPLVFLPGAGGRASFWRPVAERLVDLGPVHVFDYPGFGESAPDPAVKSLDDLYGWVVERLPPGPSHLIAQSMGGVLAARLAVEHPDRVACLVLVATSGGVDVRRLGAADWHQEYLASMPNVPRWFVDDSSDLTDQLAKIRARTLLLWSDADPISPPSIAGFLAERIAGASIVTVPGGTHSFAAERPEEIAAIIRSFLA
jgi:poly(3-hydroxyoctanoate) depolymerase